jgi:hypothetical protein
MSNEKTQGSDKAPQKSCQTSNFRGNKTTKLIPNRRYDILDLLIVSLYNAIVFGAGFGLGWLLWSRQPIEELIHAHASI